MPSAYGNYIVSGITGTTPKCTKIKLLAGNTVLSENDVSGNDPNADYVSNTGITAGSGTVFSLVLYDSSGNEIARKDNITPTW